MSTTIEISGVKESKCVEWKIPDFFQTTQDIKFKSRIPFNQKHCSLTVYPCGAHGDDPDYVIVALFLQHPDSDVSINLVFGDEDCEEAIDSKMQEGDIGEDHHKIWTWIYKKANLQILFPDDALRGRVIISCTKEDITVAACQTAYMFNTVYFRRNFQDLFLNGRKSDVSIEVQGRLFKVHKLILEACSPVFSAMFENNMSEKNNGIVKVDDCDPDTFHNFLKCLYSGKIETIVSSECLMDLYMVSDKYCVSNLKEKFSEFMVKELSEETVFEVLHVADLCNDAKLKMAAETFLVKNIKMILRTETWRKLQMENPALAVEVLTKIVED